MSQLMSSVGAPATIGENKPGNDWLSTYNRNKLTYFYESNPPRQCIVGHASFAAIAMAVDVWK